MGPVWLGRAAAAVWHAPLSILRIRAGHNTGFTDQHQAQRTNRRPHATYHRPSCADREVWCVGYFAAGLSDYSYTKINPTQRRNYIISKLVLPETALTVSMLKPPMTERCLLSRTSHWLTNSATFAIKLILINTLLSR